MTYKEAINFAKSRLEGLLPYTTEEVSEVRFYKSAIVAFEKQIPKKPLQDRIGDSYHAFPICPTCKCGLDEVTDEHHCSCGQALDWGDAE